MTKMCREAAHAEPRKQRAARKTLLCRFNLLWTMTATPPLMEHAGEISWMQRVAREDSVNLL